MLSDTNGRSLYLLNRRPYLSLWQSLALRALMVAVLFVVALAGHWFDRDGLKDTTDGKISFVDVTYFTAITITTVGYGDIIPVTDRARLFDTFVVTPIRIFVWLIFLGTAYNLFLRQISDRVRSVMTSTKLKQHIVVCGFGASGEAAVHDLMREGHTPSQIVVIDASLDRVSIALALGVVTLQGDATINSVLKAAAIDRAKAVLVSVHRDDTAALIVLSARQLNPAVTISASVRNHENEQLLRQAGANTVINPVTIGGHLLSRSSRHAHAVDFVRDIVSTDGRVIIRERLVAEVEEGLPLSALRTGIGVRLMRDGEPVGYWEVGAERMQHDDIVVEIIKLDMNGDQQNEQ